MSKKERLMKDIAGEHKCVECGGVIPLAEVCPCILAAWAKPLDEGG